MALISGTELPDILVGTTGDDFLYGRGGDDSLFGLSGDDYLDGGAGTDDMTGGTGNDTYVVDIYEGDRVLFMDSTGQTLEATVISLLGDFVDIEVSIGGVVQVLTVPIAQLQASDQVIENEGEGIDTVRASVSYVLGPNVENLVLVGTRAINGTGNELDNVIRGNSRVNVLDGGAGNDRLVGGAGNDELRGDSGNDWLDGGTESDILAGGTGNDVYVVDNAGDSVIEAAGEGIDLERSSVTRILSENVENLTLTGTLAINGFGNELDNVIRGNSAANILWGRAGDDKLFGAAGNDTIRGHSGDDRLEGGSGRDWFIGGDGADDFAFRNGDFAGMTAATSDKIEDFSQAENDRILLNLVDANTLVADDQDFQFIGTDPFNNVAGELRYEIVDGNTHVYGDTNGDGVADIMILLVGSHALTVGDFVF